MSAGRIPSPDFDQSRYERPQKDWVCGHTCEGCPCRVGPSPSGSCRASTECKPQLVLAAGETKGAWKCTRPKEWGGACENGPNPDGSCCRTVPKCKPVRSLRARRGLITRLVIAATVGLILLVFGGPWRDDFINPAPLSHHHTGPKFNAMGEDRGVPGCAACHTDSAQSLGESVTSARLAQANSLPFERFLTDHPRDFSRMDQSCLGCHAGKEFHQVNIQDNTSCSVCHREHQGTGTLANVSATNCSNCHGDPTKMASAALASRQIPAAAFVQPVAKGIKVHPTEHPVMGRTSVFTSFAQDHPEFQVLREKHKDTTPLKFNHALHLSGTTISLSAGGGFSVSPESIAATLAQSPIPLINGQPINCGSCHVPDASGAFMKQVTFEQNCRVCHSLDFDENTPGLQLPHGNPEQVRSFLRSLPAPYADYARTRLGKTREEDLAAYLKERMTSLRARAISGENLEQSAFFGDSRSVKPTGDDQPGNAARRAKFVGCNYCHEVTPKGDLVPEITKPDIPDRWLLHSKFNHTSHAPYACNECHNATFSRETSDILLPGKESCAVCHSPEGGVKNDCNTCHGYHKENPLRALKAETSK